MAMSTNKSSNSASKQVDSISNSNFNFDYNFINSIKKIISSTTKEQNPFITAMDEINKKYYVVDDKGVMSLGEDSVKDICVLSYSRIRGQDHEEFKKNISKVIENSINKNSKDEIETFVNLIVMCFETRDIRGIGKGERMLFYIFWIEMLKICPKTMIATIPLIPKYGAWFDIINLIEIIFKEINTSICKTNKLIPKIFKKTIYELSEFYIKTISKDYNNLTENKSEKFSLAAKWVPSENSKGGIKSVIFQLFVYLKFNLIQKDPDTVFKFIKNQNIVSIEQKKKYYYYKKWRQMKSALNDKLKTTEVLMCDSNQVWDRIVPSAIPSVLFNKNKLAFTNKNKKGKVRSERQDRIKCAQQIDDHLEKIFENPDGSAKINGKILNPVDIVGYIIKNLYNSNYVEDKVAEAQWINIINNLKKNGNLGNIIPMCDTSGSMTWEDDTNQYKKYPPISVAISLSLLVSELASDVFKGKILTFSSTPRWHPDDINKSLIERVKALESVSDWGQSTNIDAAFDLILEQCRMHKVPWEVFSEIRILILSDMQFDNKQNETEYNSYNCNASKNDTKIIKKIQSVYPEMDSQPLTIWWNLKDGKTLDYPANGTEPNVCMLSGYNSNVLKIFMEEDIADKKKIQGSLETPYDNIIKILNNEHFNPVRQICDYVGEIRSVRTGEKYKFDIQKHDTSIDNQESSEAKAKIESAVESSIINKMKVVEL